MKPALRKTLIALGVVTVILVAAYFLLLRGTQAQYSDADLTGPDPVIAEADEESIPTLDLLEPAGWQADETPRAAPGLTVSRFADGLDHPRSLLTLPNGDVLVAETRGPRSTGGIMATITQWVLDRVGAGGVSANRITLLRDGDGDGTAETQSVLLTGLNSPFGMALREDRLIVANTDAVLSFPFKPGQTRIEGEGEKLMDLPGGGNHWVRNLLLSEDGSALFVTVGSASNIAEKGIEQETNRAVILEYSFEKGSWRLFAGGLRNPNGLALNPDSGELWTTVNERDQLGPDGPPDYLTNVPVGAQYGWPWLYWKKNIDDRVTAPMPEFLMEYTRRPEYALGAHTAPLGLVFSSANGLGGPFTQGAFIARHGSWNRTPPSGYDVIFVPFDDRGNALDTKPITVLDGFITDGGGEAHGRPTWLAWSGRGDLLVSDDTAGIIWRVQGTAATTGAPAETVAGD